jgi:hypothetical protein
MRNVINSMRLVIVYLIISVIFAMGMSLPTELSADLTQCVSSADPEWKFSVYTKEPVTLTSYDDIISMLQHRNECCTPDQLQIDSTYFIRDYNTCEDVRVSEAFFVVHTNVPTPKVSGIVAFKDKASAIDFSNKQEGSKVLDYTSLVGADIESLWPKKKSAK